MRKFFVLPILLIMAVGCSKTPVNSAQENPPPPPVVEVPPPAPPAAIKPTSGGIPNKVYTNPKYGYSTQYPNGWFVDTTKAYLDFTQYGLKEDGDFIGGTTVFSNYKDVTSFTSQALPKDAYTVTLTVYRVDEGVTYDTFAERYGSSVKKEGIKAGNTSVMKVTQVTEGDQPGPQVVNTLIKAGTNMFVISYSGNPISSELQFAADSVVNAFRLK